MKLIARILFLDLPIQEVGMGHSGRSIIIALVMLFHVLYAWGIAPPGHPVLGMFCGTALT